MDRQTIVATLREHAPEIRSAGVLHLSLFGSAARDQMRAGSDVDLMAEFDPHANVTLLTLARLEHTLTGLVGARVELSTAAWMHEVVREHALEEAVIAF
jgi:predicted nucleotidyltransferase